MARDCKRPRPPSQGAGAGHRRAAPAVRGCSEGQSSADTSSASRESTPDLPPPRSLLVAPSPPRDNPPPEECVPELCIIERSPVIDAEVLRLRRAILVSVVGESVSLSVITALLAEVLHLSISAFSVHAAAPEDCLVLFNRMEDRDLALAHPVIPSMSFELRLKPWTPQSQATSAVMRYKVDLDIVGIPAHAWLRSTASSVLSNSCCIDSIADETILRHDLRCFRLSAWTANPGLIPAARTLAIPDEVPLGAPSPVEERHLLHYGVKVHLRGVARPRHGGPDDGPAGDGGPGPSAARNEPPLGDGPEPCRHANRRRRRANHRRRRRCRGPGAPAADAPLDAVAPVQQALASSGLAAARRCTGRAGRRRCQRQNQWVRATLVASSSRWVPRASQETGPSCTSASHSVGSRPLEVADNAALPSSAVGLQSKACSSLASATDLLSIAATAADPEGPRSVAHVQSTEEEPSRTHVSATRSKSAPAPAGHDDVDVAVSQRCCTVCASDPVDAPAEAITLPTIRPEDLPGDSVVGSSWPCSDDAGSCPPDTEDEEEWFEVPVTPLPCAQRQLSAEVFLCACEQALNPPLLAAPVSLALPYVPQRSGRITRFCGKEVPGTLSWAQKTIICKLGLAERPEQIDDDALQQYKDFFSSEVLEHRITALRELFSKDSPRNVDVAAHCVWLKVAC
ncbi:hypothetical protein ACQ4PT_007726 [Festuca glaucescens]